MASDAPSRRNESGAALLIIDMMNDLAFEGGADMRRAAEAAADTIVGLRDEADAAGMPVIYVNDNFGQWHSERSRLVDHARRDGSLGRGLVDRLAPRPEDLFVIKPQFSGFYATNLPVLLPTLGADRLILTGVAADICVLFTAADAHMRNYALWVPRDTVASLSEQRTRWALDIMAKTMAAQTRAISDLSVKTWLGEAK